MLNLIGATLNWIEENKEWFLSGLGIALFGAFLAFVKWIFIEKRNKSKRAKGSRRISIATKRGVIVEGKIKGDITTGDKNKN
ncbi:MAG: hypothetical protein F6K00_31635 [Leptolyngbya sp. SIOISBB]|nr:hypothetical protein [Leptolyngbya sp. SIOISBB]